MPGGAVSQDQDYLNRNAAAKKIKEPLEYPVGRRYSLGSSLRNPDANVSAAALDTLRKVKDVEQRPDFRTAIGQLQSSTNPRLKLIAGSVQSGKSLGDALRDVQPGAVLDFRYFVTKIEPILATPASRWKGLRVLPRESRHLQAQPAPTRRECSLIKTALKNYKYAMRVVDITNPNESLIVIKADAPL